jgi:hypothetical protein
MVEERLAGENRRNLEDIMYRCQFVRGRGGPWRSRLRHCATSRIVAGSIPDYITEIFLLEIILPVHIMALGSIQPLTEMSKI